MMVVRAGGSSSWKGRDRPSACWLAGVSLAVFFLSLGLPHGAMGQSPKREETTTRSASDVLSSVGAERLAALASRLQGIDQFGWDGFLLVAQRLGLSVVQQHPEALLERPSESIVVVAGDLGQASSIRATLASFVRNGGAVLVASDRGASAGFDFGTQVRLFPGPVEVTPDRGFQGHSDCPILDIEQLVGSSRGSSRGLTGESLLEGVRLIITNRPGYLRLQASRAPRPLVPFPNGATAGGRELLAHDGLLSAASWPQGGRAIWLADHSVLVNVMMLQGDNGRLALNLLRWLSDNGQRKKMVLIENGRAIDSFSLADAPLPPVGLRDMFDAYRELQRDGNGLPRPTSETLRQMANDFLIELEDDDTLNRALINRPRYMDTRLLRRGLFLAAALFVASVFIVQMLHAMRSGSMLRRTLAVGAAAPVEGDGDRGESVRGDPESTLQLAAGGGLLARLTQLAARDFFIGLADDNTLEPTWDKRYAPRTAALGPIWRRWSIEHQIGRLWKCATVGRQPIRRPRQLEATLRQIERLRQQHIAGEFRLKWRL